MSSLTEYGLSIDKMVCEPNGVTFCVRLITRTSEPISSFCIFTPLVFQVIQLCNKQQHTLHFGLIAIIFSYNLFSEDAANVSGGGVT